MISAQDVAARSFRFARLDGSDIGIVTLEASGAVTGYQNPNEASWSIDAGCLVLRDTDGAVTTRFDDVQRRSNGALLLRGAFLPRGADPWHVLDEVRPNRAGGVLAELLRELYSDDSPLASADPAFVDAGYPHTHLLPDIVACVLGVVKPRFWLELGSMLGGSAIRAAEAIKSAGAETEIVCIDPFTGDVNMWAWERPRRRAQEWPFLRLERGRPTIYDRFLANVVQSGHADIILPIAATSLVGLKLLRRLHGERRLSRLPDVIYLDSAHEPEETLLELRASWDLLGPGGVLLGDDWGWDAVRRDVLRFALTIRPDPARTKALAERHGRFTSMEGVLLDRGQWLLAK
jgi:hypothetical protein